MSEIDEYIATVVTNFAGRMDAAMDAATTADEVAEAAAGAVVQSWTSLVSLGVEELQRAVMIARIAAVAGATVASRRLIEAQNLVALADVTPGGNA